jgi:hypothetical protein
MRRRWRWSAGCLVLVVGAVLTSAVPAGATTKAQLQSKLLSLSNLPSGWVADNSPSAAGTTSGCLAGVKKAPKSETRATVSFVNGQMPELAEVLVTGHDNLAAYNRLNGDLAKCKQFTVTSNGQSITFTVGAMSFPAVGDESSAYQVSFSEMGLNGAADFVLFRVGSIAGVVEYADIGQPDPTQVQAYVTEAVDKVEDKATVTPTTV